jgi:membrane-associated phospholipid phosphatase
VPVFERKTIKYYNTHLARVCDAGLAVAVLAPLSVMWIPHTGYSRFAWGYAMACSGDVFLTQLSKISFPRYRPYVYNTGLPLDTRMAADGRFSFYSQHTSLMACASFYTATYFQPRIRSKKWRTIMWIGAATLPALEGWGRVRSGDHFITDVAAGYATGAIIGWGACHFNR